MKTSHLLDAAQTGNTREFKNCRRIERRMVHRVVKEQ